jgi:hypothetical protein
MNSPIGLGDFIRGFCALHELLNNTQAELRIDVSQTEFVHFIEQDPSFFCCGDPASIMDAEEIFVNHPAAVKRVQTFLESDESELYISTNLGNWDWLQMPERTRRFARKFYQFHRSIEQRIESAFCKPTYEALSVRCGDVFFSDATFQLTSQARQLIQAIIEEQILPETERPLVVTSDCFALKQELSQHYGMLCLPHPSQHGAFGNALPVVSDLCLLKRASRIFHINACADWWSGFSHFTSIILEKPSVNVRSPAFNKEEITSDRLLITNSLKSDHLRTAVEAFNRASQPGS